MPLRPNFVQIGFLELKIVISRQKLRAERAAGCTVYKNCNLQFTITIYNFQKANLNEIRIQQNTLRTNEIPAIIWNCNCKLELVHYRTGLKHCKSWNFSNWFFEFHVSVSQTWNVWAPGFRFQGPIRIAEIETGAFWVSYWMNLKLPNSVNSKLKTLESGLPT